jgi:hypothetical protein
MFDLAKMKYCCDHKPQSNDLKIIERKRESYGGVKPKGNCLRTLFFIAAAKVNFRLEIANLVNAIQA